jgi:signal transduction histidine kinase
VDGEDSTRELAVMRIVHEALHNAVRHSGAKHIRVRLTAAGVEVSDDGVGFEPEQPGLRARHLGLTSMEERARELGGTIEIRSAPGAGTRVRLEVAQ